MRPARVKADGQSPKRYILLSDFVDKLFSCYRRLALIYLHFRSRGAVDHGTARGSECAVLRVLTGKTYSSGSYAVTH